MRSSSPQITVMRQRRDRSRVAPTKRSEAYSRKIKLIRRWQRGTETKPWFRFYSHVLTSSALSTDTEEGGSPSFVTLEGPVRWAWTGARLQKLTESNRDFFFAYAPTGLLEVSGICVAVQGQFCVRCVTSGKIGRKTPHSAVYRLSGNTRVVLVRVQAQKCV